MSALAQAGDKHTRAKGLLRYWPGGEWRRLRRAAELFPWTPLGLLLSVLAYAALELFARAELDLVWLVIGYVGLGLTVVSPLLVLAASLWLRLRGPLPETTKAAGDALWLETGTWTATGFALPSPWYLPLVQVSWRWTQPPGAEVDYERRAGALHERVRVQERGRFDAIERSVRLADPFGLSRVVLRMRQPRAVSILPRLAGLSRLPSLRALASGDAAPHPMGRFEGDRIDLRRYNPGDPARFIHWKVLSRTRKLMVRTEERALSIAKRTAAFLIAGGDDDATAAVARLALERGMLGSEWLFGSDLDLTGTDRVDVALDQVMRSSAARERAGEGLAAFFERAEREGPQSNLVFAPSRPGPWLAQLANAGRRHKLRVVIGIDGVYERAEPPWFVRLFAFHNAPPGTFALDLEFVLRKLAEAGADAVVLDRSTGQTLSAVHRKAMRERERGRRARAEVA